VAEMRNGFGPGGLSMNGIAAFHLISEEAKEAS